METMEKRWQDACAEQVHIIRPEHINGSGRLFGGQLLMWIDVVAGVAARRFANSDVTTACIDHLQFLAPARAGDLLVTVGRVTWTGRTSIEVRVDSFVEKMDGRREMVNRAYLVEVALDENEKPRSVPKLILETEEDKMEWNAAEKRRIARMNAKKC